MAAHGLAHTTAELGSSHGWGEANCLYTMATLSNTSIEHIATANPAGPKWFQLYFAKDKGLNAELLQRAKAAGATAIVFAVDLERPGNREADMKNDFHFHLS
jgi:lactate oxidase